MNSNTQISHIFGHLMQKLSIVIITYNEERNIRRCLESVIEIADEIVVIDSFSTDETNSICAEFNVRFIKQKFLGYIEQKNFALQFATYDFVLSLDADEAVSNMLKNSILIAKNNCRASGYTMNRMTNYCGSWIKYGGWYPDKKLRLFEHKLGSWGGSNPHDKFMFNSPQKTEHLKGDLLHYSYYSTDDHINQIDRFTTISAKQLFDRGKKYNIIKHYVSPTSRFVKDYLLNLGFLDGAAGLKISYLSAKASYIKYYKLKKLQKSR